MLVKLYFSLFLSSKLIVFRQESKYKFESVVSEPSTSTSSLIYKRVSEKCVLLCKRSQDVRYSYGCRTLLVSCLDFLPSTFQIEPLRALFFSPFFPGLILHIIIEQRSSTRASVSDQALGDCLSPQIAFKVCKPCYPPPYTPGWRTHVNFFLQVPFKKAF